MQVQQQQLVQAHNEGRGQQAAKGSGMTIPAWQSEEELRQLMQAQAGSRSQQTAQETAKTEPAWQWEEEEITRRPQDHNAPPSEGTHEPRHEIPMTQLRRRIDAFTGRGPGLTKQIENCGQNLTQEGKRLLDVERLAAKYPKDPDLAIQCREKKETIMSLERQLRTLCNERRLQVRYERELVASSFLRERLAVAGKPLDNAKMLALASRALPDIFNGDSILLGLFPPLLRSKFENETAIQEEIKWLRGLDSQNDQSKLIRERLRALGEASETVERPDDLPYEVLELSPYVFLQYSDKRVSVPAIKIGDGQYLMFSVIRMSSQEGQQATDAVAIQAIYAHTKQMARIAITYYVPRNSSISENPELATNWQKLGGWLCKHCGHGSTEPPEETDYRLPPCILFLYLYDETEQIEDRFQTEAAYIPRCQVEDLALLTDGQGSILPATDRFSNCSIPASMFGELFRRQMLGSNWLELKDLEAFHKGLETPVTKEVGFLVGIQVHDLDEYQESSIQLIKKLRGGEIDVSQAYSLCALLQDISQMLESQGKQIAWLVDANKSIKKCLDARAKLELAIPLIPGILSMKTEVGASLGELIGRVERWLRAGVENRGTAEHSAPPELENYVSSGVVSLREGEHYVEASNSYSGVQDLDRVRGVRQQETVRSERVETSQTLPQSQTRRNSVAGSAT